MSTYAKPPAPEPLPSEADVACARKVISVYWDDPQDKKMRLTSPVIAAHVAAQTAELRAILERTQGDNATLRAENYRLRDLANRQAVIIAEMKSKLRAARKNAAKRTKRKRAM